MPIKLGNKAIKDVYLGSKKIGKIYLGSKLVYESYSPFIIIKGTPNQQINVMFRNLIGTGSYEYYTLNNKGIVEIKLKDIGHDIITLDMAFAHNDYITDIDFNNVPITYGTNTSTSMFNNAFYDCPNLVNISNFNYQNVSNNLTLNSVFYNCNNISNNSVQYFLNCIKDANISQIMNTFMRCKKITSLDLSMFDNVNKLSSAFSGCELLENITLPKHCFTVNTTTTSASEAFYDCVKLKTIDLSGWQYMPYTAKHLFRGCSNLEYVDLSNADMSNNNSIEGMFSGCTKLKRIKVKNQTAENLIKAPYKKAEVPSGVIFEIAN